MGCRSKTPRFKPRRSRYASVFERQRASSGRQRERRKAAAAVGSATTTTTSRGGGGGGDGDGGGGGGGGGNRAHAKDAAAAVERKETRARALSAGERRSLRARGTTVAADLAADMRRRLAACCATRARADDLRYTAMIVADAARLILSAFAS